MHSLFSYHRLQTVHMKLRILSCLLNSTRFVHLWTVGMEGVTFKKCVFKGSRTGRTGQPPGEQNTKSSVVISTSVTPSLHFPQLQKHWKLHYPCLCVDMKRKPGNKNEGRSDLAAKSCVKGGVEDQRTCAPFSALRTMWPPWGNTFVSSSHNGHNHNHLKVNCRLCKRGALP